MAASWRQDAGLAADYTGRRLTFKRAMHAIRAYEYEVSRALLQTLETIPGLRLYGPGDLAHPEWRVPTFSFVLDGWPADELARELDRRGIYAWDGNFYALSVTERLGLEQAAGGGLLRVGAVHYNTLEEVGKLGEALREIQSSR